MTERLFLKQSEFFKMENSLFMVGLAYNKNIAYEIRVWNYQMTF